MKKIITIGGGTGTFVVLSGLKRVPDVELSAIVSVADDGGSTGRLRDAYGSLPMGDVRQALVALSEDEGELRRLFSHRFGKGDIAGHNFGNLYLTALTEMLGSDKHALQEAARTLKVRGRVIPVSETPAILCAEYGDGTCVEGEFTIAEIREERGAIKRLFLKNQCDACDDALSAIREADRIVLGPGDIFTSTLANFTARGLPEAVAESRAKLVYVMNLFTTPESGKMTMSGYLNTIEAHVGRRPDAVVVNATHPPQEALQHYRQKGQDYIVDDLGADSSVVRADLVSDVLITRHGVDVVDRSLVRHDSQKLADVLITL